MAANMDSWTDVLVHSWPSWKDPKWSTMRKHPAEAVATLNGFKSEYELELWWKSNFFAAAAASILEGTNFADGEELNAIRTEVHFHKVMTLVVGNVDKLDYGANFPYQGSTRADQWAHAVFHVARNSPWHQQQGIKGMWLIFETMRHAIYRDVPSRKQKSGTVAQRKEIPASQRDRLIEKHMPSSAATADLETSRADAKYFRNRTTQVVWANAPGLDGDDAEYTIKTREMENAVNGNGLARIRDLIRAAFNLDSRNQNIRRLEWVVPNLTEMQAASATELTDDTDLIQVMSHPSGGYLRFTSIMALDTEAIMEHPPLGKSTYAAHQDDGVNLFEKLDRVGEKNPGVAKQRWKAKQEGDLAEFNRHNDAVKKILLAVHTDDRDVYSISGGRDRLAHKLRSEQDASERDEAALTVNTENAGKPALKPEDLNAEVKSSLFIGPSLPTALKSLRGIDELGMHHPQAPNHHSPRAHQITGAAHMMRNDSLAGFLINSDAVGTGKTMSTAMALSEIALRHKENRTHERPTLLVVPASILNEWIGELRKWENLEVRLYWGTNLGNTEMSKRYQDIRITDEELAAGSGKARFAQDEMSILSGGIGDAYSRIVVTTYNTFMMRSLELNAEFKRPAPGNDQIMGNTDDADDSNLEDESLKWKIKSQFRDLFEPLICDEAHFLRGGGKGSIFQSLKLASIPKTWLVSATPMFGGVGSFAGLLEMGFNQETIDNLLESIVGDSLSQGEFDQRLLDDFNPYSKEFDDSPLMMYRLSPDHWKGMINRTAAASASDTTRFRAFRQVLSMLQLKRKLSTVIDHGNGVNQAIGHGMKPTVVETIQLMFNDLEEAEYRPTHQELAKKLLFFDKTANVPGKKVQAQKNMGAYRRLILNSSSLRMTRLDRREQGETRVEDVQKWYESPKSYGMEWFANRTCLKDDVREHHELNWEDDPIAFFQSLAVGSPKLRYLCKLVEQICVTGGRQLLVFTTTPFTTWFLKSFFEKVGLTVEVIVGSTSAEDREKIKAKFNRGGLCDILVTEYRVGSIAINLHGGCHECVHFEVEGSANEGEQADGRLDRLGQQHAVHVYRLVVLSSVDEYLDAKIQDNIMQESVSWGGDSLSGLMDMVESLRQQGVLTDEVERQAAEEIQALLQSVAQTLLGSVGQRRFKELSPKVFSRGECLFVETSR